MSDFNNVSDLQESAFVDIFAPKDGDPQPQLQTRPSFGGGLDNNADLFNRPKPNEQQQDQGNTESTTSTTTTTTLAPEDQQGIDPNKDVDILGGTPQDDANKAGRRPKYDFTDATGYFADRIKNGKFVAVEEELPDGTKKPFIPKTPEDFDEIIDIQVNHRLEQGKKDLDQKWYTSKTPAWQAVARYAEMVDDPSEVIPFIQGVRTIQSVAEVDESQIEGAEQIVRVRLEQRGDPQDVINEQIEVLKSSDKLISTAQKYKPMIVKQEQQQLQQMIQQKKEEDARYTQLVDNIRENTIKAIEAPLFGNVKLKQDEKMAVYDLIGEPDEESQGYKIYAAIDSLYEQGKFDTLKKLALILAKEESFVKYISANAATQAAGQLERKLRVSTEGRGPTNDPDVDEGRQTVTRNQYRTGARFGRYEK